MEKYELVKQIGQGSYGDVWLVRKSTKSSKLYVLKQINLEHAPKREQRAAHLEVKLLSTLKHPNIVSYLDSFYNSNGSLYIVMGYCESGDLYTYIRKQKGNLFEEKQIVEWLVQICMALKYLHERKILHRDLKTQNIFLTRSKLIKVGDLGIARVLDGTKDMATTLIGTPYYMSPELYCNKPYNHKSDVWALGCCVHEMATLRHAFNARNLNSLMQKILNGKLSGIPKIYSPDLVQIIYSMLNHDPEKRPNVADILMNVYVRKYIELFLEETKHSCRQSYGKVKKQSMNEIFAKNNTAVLSKIKDAKRETSRPARRYCIRNLKYMPDNSEENMCSVQKVTVSVPDINGNGDGNDNSRQRFLLTEKVKKRAESKTKVKNSFNSIKHNTIQNKAVSKFVVTEIPKVHLSSHRNEVNVSKHTVDSQLPKARISNYTIAETKGMNIYSESENQVVTSPICPRLVEATGNTKKISVVSFEEKNSSSSSSKMKNFQYNSFLNKLNAFSLIFIPSDISQLSPLEPLEYLCIKSDSVNDSSNCLPSKSKARLRRRYNVNVKKNDITFSSNATKIFKPQNSHLQNKERINSQSEAFFDQFKDRNLFSANSEKECRISYCSKNESYDNIKSSSALLLSSSLPEITQIPVNKKITNYPDDSKVDSSLLKEIMNNNVGSLTGHPNSAARQRRRQQFDNKFNKVARKNCTSKKVLSSSGKS